MTDIVVDCVAAVYFHWFDCSEHCVITPYCGGCSDFLVPAAPAGREIYYSLAWTNQHRKQE